MQPQLRTTIAFIAGRIITGLDTSSIYDHRQARSVRIDGSVTPHFVKIFDNDRGCYTSGLGEGNVFELYDFGGQHPVELRIDGHTFEGYDEQTPCRFSGEVQGNEITLYDDGAEASFAFRLDRP